MDDNERMIAAARRSARRLARRTAQPYQACLDLVARDCGRRHWSDFMASPAPIPREEDRRSDVERSAREAMTLAIGRPHEMREVWVTGDGELPDPSLQGVFLPRFNALSPAMVPADRDRRRAYVGTVAEALLPRPPRGDGYFDAAGRRTLSAFLLLTVEHMEGLASIPATLDMISGGLRTASEMADADRFRKGGRTAERPDRLAQWLGTLDVLVRERGYDEAILDGIVPLVSMAPNERSGILGRMDQALIPFKNPEVRRRTS